MSPPSRRQPVYVDSYVRDCRSWEQTFDWASPAPVSLGLPITYTTNDEYPRP